MPSLPKFHLCSVTQLSMSAAAECEEESLWKSAEHTLSWKVWRQKTAWLNWLPVPVSVVLLLLLLGFCMSSASSEALVWANWRHSSANEVIIIDVNCDKVTNSNWTFIFFILHFTFSQRLRQRHLQKDIILNYLTLSLLTGAFLNVHSLRVIRVGSYFSQITWTICFLCLIIHILIVSWKGRQEEPIFIVPSNCEPNWDFVCMCAVLNHMLTLWFLHLSSLICSQQCRVWPLQTHHQLWIRKRVSCHTLSFITYDHSPSQHPLISSQVFYSI